MKQELYSLLLWMSVLWPLLLALPVLHSRLSRCRHIAILPAAILLLLPVETSAELPWLLFGYGLSLQTDGQWLLAMTVVTWLLAASITSPLQHTIERSRETTFFLLTMASNLGAVLASDLVMFFSFTTIMGYSFYALLVQTQQKTGRASRVYLIFLILADLALFEALLLAAFTTEDLRFEAVGLAMSDAPFYVWVTACAFALKAGLWPFHIWLSGVLSTASVYSRLLLWAVPVSMALTGLIRWLPTGLHHYPAPALLMQLLGGTAVLLAIIRYFKHHSLRYRLFCLSIAASGLFFAATGTGLGQADVWQSYAFLACPFMAIVGMLFALLSWRLPPSTETTPQIDSSLQPLDACIQGGIRGTQLIGEWTNKLSDLPQSWHTPWASFLKQRQNKSPQQADSFYTGWRSWISLFVLLGLIFAWLAK